MNSFVINPIEDSEISILQQLAESIWHQCYRDMISPAQIAYMLNQRYQAHQLREALARGERLLAARVNGVMVGFAHTLISSDNVCKLDKLYVSPNYQRLGIGSGLVQEVEHFARQHHCEQLMLRVYRGNQQALNAYRKYGFSLIREFKEDIGNGFFMDDCVMGKPVSLQ